MQNQADGKPNGLRLTCLEYDEQLSMTDSTQTSSWKINLLMVLFGCGVAFGVGEALIRALDYYQYVKSSNREQFEQYKKVYSDERGTDYVFGHQSNVSVTLKNGDHSYTFVSNTDGLRETQDYGDLDRSVIFLGDSIIEGVPVENDETVDAVFEELTGITSLNFGVGSSNTVHEYHWLKAKYKESYRAQLVVLGFCLNDFPQNTYLRYFDTDLGNWPLYKYHSDKEATEASAEPTETARKGPLQTLKAAVRASRLVVYVYSSLQNVQAEKEQLPPFRAAQVTDEQAHYTDLYLQKIRRFSEEIGSDFVVVIFPQESQFQHDYTQHDRMQAALVRILERNDIPFIDLHDVLETAYRDRPDVGWYHDDTHLYEDGYRLVAEHLVQTLPGMFPEIFPAEPSTPAVE